MSLVHVWHVELLEKFWSGVVAHHISHGCLQLHGTESTKLGGNDCCNIETFFFIENLFLTLLIIKFIMCIWQVG